MLDDDTLDPRNECCLVISQLSRLIFEEVACCCIEVIHLVDPVFKQRIVKVMVNRPCNHMPDVAQQVVDTFLFRWTWQVLVSLLWDGVDSNLMDGITKKPIISSIGKKNVVIIVG
jgi:hypothetical protein